MRLYVLSSVLWRPLRFPPKHDVRFVFTSGCLYEGSWLVNVICAYLRIFVPNKYFVVFFVLFLFVLFPYVAIFYGLEIFDSTSVFSNFYLLSALQYLRVDLSLPSGTLSWLGANQFLLLHLNTVSLIWPDWLTITPPIRSKRKKKHIYIQNVYIDSPSVARGLRYFSTQES